MLVLKVLLCFIWMCVLPFLTGTLLLPFFRSRKEESYALLLAVGLAVHYTLFELLTLAGKPLGWGMRRVALLYGIIAGIMGVSGLVRILLKKEKLLPLKCPSFKEDPWFYAALLLILLQIAAELFWASPDLDDAFYSGLSSMSIAHDFLLEKNAYSGAMSGVIEARYVLSALPVYQGALSVLSMGLHPLVIQHNLFPLFYMPLAYALYFAVGRKLRTDKPAGPFLLVLALLHLFGNYYVFSHENFLTTRLWQGKALFVALGIPLLWLLTLMAAGEKKLTLSHLLLAFSLMAVTFMGETGLFLGPVLVMVLTLSVCIVDKKIIPLGGAMLCCLPQIGMLLWVLGGV